MAVVQWSDDEDRQSSAVPLDFFPVTPLIQENDLSILVTDFFDWLETAWQLPLFQPDVARLSLPPPLTLTEELYTIPDLARLCGCTFDWLYRYVERFQIVSPGYVPYLSPTGTKGQCRAFRKEDLALFLEQWEWKRFIQVLDQWWLRFFPPACGTCYSCRRGGRSPMAQQFFCSGCVPLNNLRVVFTHFLQELRHLGSVAAWWQEHQADTWKKRICSASGILVIYLLDRRLVHLSLDELIQFAPVSHKDHHHLTRLWRNRRPEEYAQFLHAMEAASYRNSEIQHKVFAMVGLFILLKYGLAGLTELGRVLSAGELEQVRRDRRLVTFHLGSGVFLPHRRQVKPDSQVLSKRWEVLKRVARLGMEQPPPTLWTIKRMARPKGRCPLRP